MNFYHKLY